MLKVFIKSTVTALLGLALLTPTQLANAALSAEQLTSSDTSIQSALANDDLITKANTATYTLADVAKNNTKASCWTVVSGFVYNITTYISRHPGGASSISKICGVDGTTTFNNMHGGASSQAIILSTYKIGALGNPPVTSCVAGYFISIVQNTCIPAPIGFFVTAADSAAGALAATPCPIGFTTATTGSTTASACYEIANVPTITDVSSSTGKRGQAIDIVGTNLDDAPSSTLILFTAVTSKLAAVSTPVTVLSVNAAGTRMTVLSPAVSQKGVFRITTSRGIASAPTTFTASTTVTSKPAITMTASLVKEVGSEITLSGTNLASATSITIGSVNAPIRILNATTVVITVPAGVVSGAKISATNPGGTTTTTKFVFQAPVIATTTAAAKVGQTVTITGSNLKATSVIFGGNKTAKPVINDGETLTAVVPTGALTGPIKVTTGGGVVYTSSFTVTPPTPTVTSFTPTSGKKGVTLVTVKGTNLTGATVAIGATPVTISAGATSTSLKFTIPTGAASGKITVTTGGGSATSSSSLTIN
jgi:cytochrome b involved in lipid metabolism